MVKAAQLSLNWTYPFLSELAFQGSGTIPLSEAREKWGPGVVAGRYKIGPLSLEVINREDVFYLKNPPEILSESSIRSFLKEELKGLPITIFPYCDSTNEVLAKRAGKMLGRGIPLGAFVASETQLKGRGRWGRRWSSPPFIGLWFSLWCPAETVDKSVYLSVACAVAVIRVLKKLLNNDISICWPNDFFIENGKVGGILIEPVKNGWVIGIGLNVLGNPEQFVEEKRSSPPVSISQFVQKQQDRNQLLAFFIDEIISEINLLKQGKQGLITLEWKNYQRLYGRKVCLKFKDRLKVGKVKDVDPERGISLESCNNWFFPEEVFRLEEIYSKQ